MLIIRIYMIYLLTTLYTGAPRERWGGRDVGERTSQWLITRIRKMKKNEYHDKIKYFSCVFFFFHNPYSAKLSPRRRHSRIIIMILYKTNSRGLYIINIIVFGRSPIVKKIKIIQYIVYPIISVI